jgi:hypothetical protein
MTPTWPSRCGGYEVAADADAPDPIQREIAPELPPRLEKTGDNLRLEEVLNVLAVYLTGRVINRSRKANIDTRGNSRSIGDPHCREIQDGGLGCIGLPGASPASYTSHFCQQWRPELWFFKRNVHVHI